MGRCGDGLARTILDEAARSLSALRGRRAGRCGVGGERALERLPRRMDSVAGLDPDVIHSPQLLFGRRREAPRCNGARNSAMMPRN
jgi:hypothetical protein